MKNTQLYWYSGKGTESMDHVAGKPGMYTHKVSEWELSSNVQ